MLDKFGFWLGVISAIITITLFISQYWTRLRAIRDRLGGKKSIFVLLTCSFVLSAIAIYRSVDHTPNSLTVTISAYQPQYPSPIRVVKGQMFADQDIPLDGYDYDHVTFKNVCFIYDGGSYELQSVVLQDHWSICAKDERIKNFQALAATLGFLNNRTTYATTSRVKAR